MGGRGPAAETSRSSATKRRTEGETQAHQRQGETSHALDTTRTITHVLNNTQRLKRSAQSRWRSRRTSSCAGRSPKQRGGRRASPFVHTHSMTPVPTRGSAVDAAAAAVEGLQARLTCPSLPLCHRRLTCFDFRSTARINLQRPRQPKRHPSYGPKRSRRRRRKERKNRRKVPLFV